RRSSSYTWGATSSAGGGWRSFALMSRWIGCLRIIGWRRPMNKSKLVVVLTLALGGAAVRAEAQVADVSLGVGGVNVSGGGGSWSFTVHSPALDARANVRVSERFSIEP